MAKKWKKYLAVFLVAGVFYAGCNTRSILATESFFRNKAPGLSISPKICYLLASISYYTFRYRLALGITERNLRDFPYEAGTADAELRRARCHENLGHCSEAIDLYSDFLLSHPRDNRYRKIQNRIAKLQVISRNEQ
jgi:hypothetical protein